MLLQKMSSLDYSFVAAELKRLAGSRLAKVYELEPGKFRFKFSKEGSQYHLLAELGVRMHLTKFVEEAPERPTDFAMALRKYLDNAAVAGVRQLNSDRLVEIALEKKERYLLVFEMFGTRGNLLLCEADGKIIQPYTTEEKGGRTLKRGLQYHAPRPGAGLGVPPVYQEEVLSRAGLRGKPPGELGETEKKTAEAELEKIRSCAPEPTVYYEGGKPVAFSSIGLEKHAGTDAKSFETLSEALDEYYAGVQPEAAQKPKETAAEKALKKLEFLAEQQRKTAEENEAKADELKQIGDAIWANLEKADELILKAKKDGKKTIEAEI